MTSTMKQNNYLRLLWRKPSLEIPSLNTHKQASWLELFFDLVMIVAFSKIEQLMHPISITGLVIALLAFFSVAIGWINIMYYSQRFEHPTIRHRLIMFCSMFLLLGNALAFSSASNEYFIQYAQIGILLFVLMRLFMAYIWMSAASRDKTHYIYQSSRAYALALILSAFFASMNILLIRRFFWLPLILWALALVIEMFLPHILFILQNNTILKNLAPQHTHEGHTSERIGLFVMLMLGEMVMMSTILADKQISPWYTFISSGIILLGVCFLWWIYFDRIIIHNKRTSLSWLFFQVTFIFSLLLCNVAISMFMQSEDWTFNHTQSVIEESIAPHTNEQTSEHSSEIDAHTTESMTKALLPFVVGIMLLLVLILALYRNISIGDDYKHKRRMFVLLNIIHTVPTVIVNWGVATIVYFFPSVISAGSITLIIFCGLLYQVGVGVYYWYKSMVYSIEQGTHTFEELTMD